uniref:DNA-binding protein n=1 Tax=Fervidicoccus fontis TaxID=683846 RepID=A0A7C1I367_9CREN
MRFFLFSIRPLYADAVFSGVKKYELRRGFIDELTTGDIVFLYVSGNEQRIKGLFRAGRIFRGTPQEVWRYVSSDPLSGIGRDTWQYIAGSSRAVAVEVVDPCVFSRQPSLHDIRAVFPRWSPPLSYSLLSEKEPVFLLFLEQGLEECLNKK